MAFNTFRNDSQFFRNLPQSPPSSLAGNASSTTPLSVRNSSSSTSSYNKVNYPNNKKIKNVIGTYKLSNYNLAFPVGSENYPIGQSPIESSIIIDRQDGPLVWGSVYFKPVSTPKWRKSNFTGTIDCYGVISLNIDSKTAPNGDIALYTLTPYNVSSKYSDNSKGYQVVFRAPGRGLSFISFCKRIALTTVVPK